MQMYRLNHDEDVDFFTKKQIITTKLQCIATSLFDFITQKKKNIYLMNLHFPFRACSIGKIVGIHCIILRFYDSFVTREKGTYLPRQWTCCFLIKLWQKKNVWLFRRSDRVQALILFVRHINDETVKKFNRYSQA